MYAAGVYSDLNPIKLISFIIFCSMCVHLLYLKLQYKVYHFSELVLRDDKSMPIGFKEEIAFSHVRLISFNLYIFLLLLSYSITAKMLFLIIIDDNATLSKRIWSGFFMIFYIILPPYFLLKAPSYQNSRNSIVKRNQFHCV